MDNQRENNQELSESGVPTPKDKEAILIKTNKTTNKRLCIVGVVVVVAVIGLIFTLFINHRNSEASHAETPQWEITNIDGVKAVQTQFHNQDYGILQVAYSPSFGVRFGLFDNSMRQIPITGGIAGFSRIVTKEEVDADYEKMKADGFADEEYYQMYLEEVGNLYSQLFAFPTYKDGFIYLSGGNAEKLISQIDKGTAKSLLLKLEVEDSESPDGYTYYEDYEWFTKFAPGEFFSLISKL